jgi:hypothetical protein
MDATLAKAVRAGTAARMASAAARRVQIAQLRITLDMHKAQNQHRRRQVSAAIVRLRGGCTEFRRQVRLQLRKIAARAARRPR